MTTLASLVIFFFAIVIHECAHGWVAFKLGDSTAKYSGRLTLNPIAHIDPFGTLLLPLLLIITRSPVIFGWAKPIPINFRSLHNPKRDILWVGLAGPVSNIMFALILTAALKIMPIYSIGLYSFLKLGILLNLILAIFNLVPIPPLDGSRVLFSLLPHDIALSYSRLERYGMIIIFMLLYLGLFNFIINIAYSIILILNV